MLRIAPTDEWTCNPATGEVEAIGTTEGGDVIRCGVTLAAVADWFDCEPTPEACLAAARLEATTLVAAWSVRAAVRAFAADGSVLPRVGQAGGS